MTTKAQLAHVDIKFGSDTYSLAEESEPYRQHVPAQSTTREAWIRPLSGIVELTLVGEVRAGQVTRVEQWITVPAIRLSFANLGPIEIPISVPDYRGERDRITGFTDALRAVVQ